MATDLDHIVRVLTTFYDFSGNPVVVAPYNAQVSRLAERLGPTGVRPSGSRLSRLVEFAVPGRP